MRIVLDTNVLVSGLLSPLGPPGRIVDLLLAGEIELAHDDRIVAEYREVLFRPKRELDPADVDAVLASLVADGYPVVARPFDVELPDRDDLPFLEVAAASGAEALVTGNLRHYPAAARPEGLRVESPATFLRRWYW